jgi:hypothetical protein
MAPRRYCHKIKSRVEARWPPSTVGFSPNWKMASGADTTWYGATVVDLGADMTYSLRYDDGGEATGVGTNHVRTPQAPKRPRACVPFCHPGTEKRAFGICPPDGFLVNLDEAAPAGKRKRQEVCARPNLTVKVPAWTLEDGDQRYVVEHLGRTVEFNGNGTVWREGPAENLRFWAEYSGPAQVIENRGKPGPGYHCEPTRVSKIFMDPQAWALHITDIDPSIFFGFNYTLCKQHSCVKMAMLDGGSIILFGSVGGEEGWQKEPRQGRFYLDTVFVTGASVEVSTGKRDRVDGGNTFSKVIISESEWSEYVGEERIREALEDKDVPAGTRAAWYSLFDGPSVPRDQKVAMTGSHPGASELPTGRWPTQGSRGPEVRRVYKGVGFNERGEYDGMFSFVPVWRMDAGPALRQRPTLDLDELSKLGMPWPQSGKRWPAALNGQLTGAVTPELSPVQMKMVWDAVVAQVRAQNYEIGSWFSPPPPMPDAIASALEAGVELRPAVTISMAESDVAALKKGQRVIDAHWQEDLQAVWTIDRVLSGPALRLRKGKATRVISLVDRAQREALSLVA